MKFQKLAYMFLILTAAAVWAPVYLFAQGGPPPVPTNDTGTPVPTQTLEQAERQDKNPKTDNKETPPSAPLKPSTTPGATTLNSYVNEPAVTIYNKPKDTAPKSLFSQSLLQRLGQLVGKETGTTTTVSQLNNQQTQETATQAAASGASGTAGAANVSASAVSTSTAVNVPAPANQVSPGPSPGKVTQAQNVPLPSSVSAQAAAPSSQATGLDKKTLDNLPSAVFGANVPVGNAGQREAVAGSAAGGSSSSKEVREVKLGPEAREERPGSAREEASKHLGKRSGTVEERLAGAPKTGSANKSLLLGEGPAETGWLNALETHVNRKNISDGIGREPDIAQSCVSFSDTDGITKMIESERVMRGEESGPEGTGSRTLYAYGQDESNIVFITVLQLDKNDHPIKAARLFADGRIQVFGQLKNEAFRHVKTQSIADPPVPALLFAKAKGPAQEKGYQITGVLISETISHFFLDKTKGAFRAPCPRALAKK